MGVGAGGTPQGDRQTDGRLGAGEATVPCAQNSRGEGNERGRALPSCAEPGQGAYRRGEKGVFPFKHSPMAWRKMAFHLSVVLLGE